MGPTHLPALPRSAHALRAGRQTGCGLRGGWRFVRVWLAWMAVLGLVKAGWVSGQTPRATVKVRVDQPGMAVPATLYGIFFEEINSAGDGGLYAELVRNRSFEEPGGTNHWVPVVIGSAQGSWSLDQGSLSSTNNRWGLRMEHRGGAGQVGVANEGWFGMAFHEGETYVLRVRLRAAAGFAGPLVVRLEPATGGSPVASSLLYGLADGWRDYELELTATRSVSPGRLFLALPAAGTVWLDFVSLFPKQTWNGRTNGLRRDLMARLVDLAPAFVRFPGGCWVEGEWLTNAWRWKETIGPLPDRATRWNLWGYWSPNGLGLLEYLLLCRDLGAEPLLVVNCGMSHREVVPLSGLDVWVRDALDAVEFANGPVTSRWGAVRAALGHPEPFGLKYLQIGNENGGPAYDERYARFYDALKSRYPDLTLVACDWGGLPASRPVEISDEHFYNNPRFFLANARRYDFYPRSGPRIFVGEYAVTSGAGNGNLMGALAEAAFLTGVERNADVVVMASYAPLFARLENKAWNPDLIYFDAVTNVLTPSYHVQRMFARNRPDRQLPLTLTWEGLTPPGTIEPRGAIGLGSWNTQVEYRDVVVRQGETVLYASAFDRGAPEWQVYRGDWSTVAGGYRQDALIVDCRSVTGNTSWTNYTLTLRARKRGGQEGFLILFHWKDPDNWTWWNLGGWNNTQHALELCDQGAKGILGEPVPGTIVADRWYDIRIELEGTRVRCYLDGQLVHDVRYPGNGARGAVGVGTWATRASFSRLSVTQGGQTLYTDDFTNGLTGWRLFNGQWSAGGGLLRQTSLQTDCRATVGDVQWTDYTLRVRARKDGGQEGFLVLFHWQDDQNWAWWNIGGWNNTRHAVEVCRNGVKSTLGPSVPGSIETGRWYDIRVELEGTRIRCYLDDQLVHDVRYLEPEPIYGVAGWDETRRQVIVKLVNVTGESVPVDVSLEGVSRLAPGTRFEQLTHPDPRAENSLDAPARVAPLSGELDVRSPRFQQTLPPWSLTVWRIPVGSEGALRLDTDPAPYGQLVRVDGAGLRLRLNAYPTTPVRLAWEWEGLDGRAGGSGELRFEAGQPEQTLAPPDAGLWRLRLQQLEGEPLILPGALVVGRMMEGDEAAGLCWWHGDGQLWLWWTQMAVLQAAPGLAGPWTNVSEQPPVTVTCAAGKAFYRLAAP